MGNIELVGELVEVTAAGGSAADLFLVTEYIDGTALEGAALGTRRGRLCMTLDMTHVENGTCELGVRSTPKVAILVNRQAASASGLRFATAFRVMITEI